VSKSVAVLVAGMHRSGTSATAGALNIAGVPLGEKLLPPTPENAKGYWENAEVVTIHDALLEALDFSWDDVRPLPNGWEKSAAASAARDSLSALIVREFARTDLWAVKDPRLCRLIPLWRDVLREFAIEPTVLIVVRSPSEVAASIRARDGWLDGVGELLWLRHLSEAEAASRQLRRCAITFDQLLASPVAALTKIASRLQLRLPRTPSAVAHELEGFVDAGERHHRVDAGGNGADPSVVASLTRQLHEAMAHVAETGRGWDRVQRLADMAHDGIDRQGHYVLALANGVARYRRAESAARAECERVRHELVAKENTVATVEKECERVRSELIATRAELESVMQSKSWRVTAPLRWTNRVVGKLMGRPKVTRTPDHWMSA
jgi:hypothetical protein